MNCTFDCCPVYDRVDEWLYHVTVRPRHWLLLPSGVCRPVTLTVQSHHAIHSSILVHQCQGDHSSFSQILPPHDEIFHSGVENLKLKKSWKKILKIHWYHTKSQGSKCQLTSNLLQIWRSWDKYEGVVTLVIAGSFISQRSRPSTKFLPLYEFLLI